MDVDVAQPTVLDLCSGFGGFQLAFEHAGLRPQVLAYVERESYAAAILLERMEQERLPVAPVWCGDLEDLDTAPFVGVDIVCGGAPCQPFSSAGKQQGVDDDRWLWPAIGRIIGDLGCRYVFLENVSGLVRAGLPHVLADLADLGFDAEWGLLPASAVGAPHRRERCWILAHTNGGRLEGVGQLAGSDRGGMERDADGPSSPHVADTAGPRRDIWRRQTIEPSAIGRGRPTDGRFPPRPDDTAGWERWSAEGGPQPGLRRGTDGRPAGLADALHLGGNGLVPQCAAEALRQLAERIN